MKSIIQILARCAILVLTATTAPVYAAEKHAHSEAHGHGHAHKTTPHGGRILDKTDPHAELVIGKDRTVTVHFFSETKEELKQIPVSTQTLILIADTPKGSKTKLEFERKGDSLVSKSKLPEGDGYNIVVQFKQTPESKPQNLRFKLNMETCAECKQAEYACTCDH